MSNLDVLMTAMAVESAMHLSCKLNEIVSKYKANNIDVIPISEIEKIMRDSTQEALKDNSLTSRIMEEHK